MSGLLRGRGRAAVLMLGVGTAVLVAGGATNSWASAGYLAPLVFAAAFGLWLLAGRESDAGAIMRRHVDERQALQRLQVQALVGRVLALAVAISYLVAVSTKVTSWPFGLLLGVLAAAFVAGRLLYGAHGPQGGGQLDQVP